MTSKQVERHGITYHPEDIQNRGTNKVPDVRAYLPDEIGDLGLEEGDSIEIEKNEASGDPYPRTVPYLVGRESDDESEGEYKIFTDGSQRLRMTITPWKDLFNEDKNVPLVVEVNQREKTFRIYRNEDYHYRLQDLYDRDIHPQLKQKGVVPLVAYPRKEGTQKFRIIPFNCEHNIFSKVAAEFDKEKRPSNPAVFHEVLEKGELPRCTCPKLTVYWDPDGNRASNKDNLEAIYTATNVEEEDILLPTEGYFRVLADHHEKATWFSHDEPWGHSKQWEMPVVGKWEGPNIKADENDEYIAVYVPCASPK
ncbi:hypothetical protein [Salinilacihabitans rarus]|uniref:hypothetical protein n=1 Tax=Salinilacihabitans rarus TaxID=2961596 RepID=UPI0020C92D70|nr:hypothetical protein [Salinilacihabitans rarus]